MSKENRVSDERLTLIASGIADRLGAGASAAPDLERDIASAITELLSRRSKPVAGVEVKPLVDFLWQEFCELPDRKQGTAHDPHAAGYELQGRDIAPSPSMEMEVLAWRGGKEDGSRKYTEIKRVSEIWADQGLTVIPMVRQSTLLAAESRALSLEEEVKRLEQTLIEHASKHGPLFIEDIEDLFSALRGAALKENGNG